MDSVFPGITVLTLICNLLEVPVYKLRVRGGLCSNGMWKKPVGMVGGRRVLCQSLMFASISALMLFPSGALWFVPALRHLNGGTGIPAAWLCWPCVQYARIDTASGGSCSGQFESTTCRAPEWAGEAAAPEVDVAHVRRHLASMKRFNKMRAALAAGAVDNASSAQQALEHAPDPALVRMMSVFSHMCHAAMYRQGRRRRTRRRGASLPTTPGCSARGGVRAGRACRCSCVAAGLSLVARIAMAPGRPRLNAKP